jgi:YD repeat-containing protein
MKEKYCPLFFVNEQQAMKPLFFAILFLVYSISAEAQLPEYYYLRESYMDTTVLKRNNVKEVQYWLIEEAGEKRNLKFRMEKYDSRARLTNLIFQYDDTIRRELEYQYDQLDQRFYERSWEQYRGRDSLKHYYFFEDGRMVRDSVDSLSQVRFTYDPSGRLVEKCNCGSIHRKEPEPKFYPIFGFYVSPIRNGYDFREIYFYNAHGALFEMKKQYLFAGDTAAKSQFDIEERYTYSRNNVLKKKMHWRPDSEYEDTTYSYYDRQGKVKRKLNEDYKVRYFYQRNGNKAEDIITIYKTERSPEEKYKIRYKYIRY